MYAVVTTGGKQYRVEAGSELTIERLAADAGTSVTFDRVLMVGDGETVTIGTPVVDGASVSATVLGEALGPKLVIFKFKQKVKYRRHTGHRQHLTRVRIDDISTGSRRAKAQRSEAEEPAKGADADAPEKPKRARRPAAKAASAEKSASTKATADDKPKAAPRRRTTKKAEAED